MGSEHYEKYGKAHYQRNRDAALAKAKERYDLIGKDEWYAKRRNTILRSRYGITSADYDKLFEQQQGRCAICDANFSGSARKLDVDHDHETGNVRGLLCNNCNRGLGHFQDNAGFLEVAAKYLKQGGSCGV